MENQTEEAKETPAKRKRRKWPWIVLIVIVVILIALIAIGNYLVNFAIRRTGDSTGAVLTADDSEETDSQIEENLEWIEAQTDEWLAETDQEVVSIVSDDDLVLEGDVFWTDEDSHLWLIAVHGYNGQRSGMYDIAAFYAEEGYNILTPDMRAHGESEGTYVGMGWLDRMDLLLWIDYVLELDPDAEIVLHGVSMGGATVMMVSGEELPDNVKAIVEDCGYTSVWDIFSDELDALFGLPEFPILYIADGISKIRAGYSFSEASSVKQVANAEVPILFIHGSEDTFVRTDMVYEVYEACSSEKELLVVEGAAHAESYKVDPELYFETVFSFLENYV